MNGWSWKTEIEERVKPAGAVKSLVLEGRNGLIGLEQGMARVIPFGEGMIRVTFTDSGFKDLDSLAVVKPSEGAIKLSEEGDCFSLWGQGITINGRKGATPLTVLGKGNKVLFRLDTAFIKSKGSISLETTIAPHQKFYGLGEKTGFLDKRGRRYTMWNTDDPLHTPDKDPLYKSIPFLISKNDDGVFGLFVDSIALSQFDLGFENPELLRIAVNDEELDLYIIEGSSIKEILSRYTQLTGRMKLPPLWSLGYQQCRWSYYPEERIDLLAQEFKSRDIPCDAIYLDIDYMDEFRVFSFDSNRFPHPEQLAGKLREQGIRLVTIIDPGVKKDSDYPVYLEGARKDYFCKLPTGEVYHGKVWPGISAYPDFSKTETRKWWGERHATLFDKGISGIWNDMNEPSDFSVETHGDRTLAAVPNDVMMDFDGKPRSFAKSHNAYGLLMCMATLEGFKALKPNERPFIVTRSAYAGIQRYSAVWTGDNHSWWEHLASSIPMYLNIGLSGVPFVGGDVGGFQGECEPELFARWIQLGAFTPFLRAHSVIHSKDHEPWAFGQEVERISREAIKLRYSLMPYFYSEMRHAAETGQPLMRPMVLEFENDPMTHRIDDQFMVGPWLLVAPVVKRHARKRMVYLPEGGWYDCYTKAYYTGGTTIIAEAPLDRIPLFIRAGAILPFTEPGLSTELMSMGNLRFEIYTGASGVFDLYEDDGRSFDYREGRFNLYRLTLSQVEERQVLGMEALSRGYEHGFKTAEVIVYNAMDKPVRKVLTSKDKEITLCT